MKRVMIGLGLVLLVGGSGSRVLAAGLAGFFACTDIVFFGTCSKTAVPTPAQAPETNGTRKPELAQKPVSPLPSARPPQVEESMWAEPVRGPDGQLRVYLPPKSVRDFLEKPTPENARAYLAWNQARMRQMDEAVTVMRDVAAQQFGIATPGPITVSSPASVPGAPASHGTPQLASPTPPLLPQAAPKAIPVQGTALDNPATRPISIVYAFATWCPYSRQQTPIINQLATHVEVRGIAFDSKPEEVQALRPALAFPVMQGDVDLRQRLGVRSYPTIFFFEGSRLLHVARGLQPLDRLVAVLAALAGRQPLPASESNVQPASDTCQPRT